MITAYRSFPLTRRLAASVLLAAGLLGMLAGGGLYATASYTAWEYASSEEGQRASEQAEELNVRPVWVDEAPASADGDALSPHLPLPRGEAGSLQEQATGQNPAPLVDEGPLPSSGVREPTASGATAETEGVDSPTAAAPEPPAPEPRAAATEIELASAELRFADPPEPGARARLVLGVRNRSDASTDTLSLAISNRWFDSYRVVAAVPDVLDDRLAAGGARHFDFPGLAAGESTELELHLVATDEDLRAPEVRLGLAAGPEIGQAQPQIFAPRPRPGPARAVSIPRLGLQSGVVQTAWEPPPFVVGQIRGTANLSQGNTVLIGHLNGLGGNVFASLDRLRPGDEVIAVSRGLEYRFVVSETMVLEGHESGPMGNTDTPRLTLMTCTGRWNPFTQDYSHRLWVVAEPEELARQTIAANAARAAANAASATASALAPTATPVPEATPVPTQEPASAAAGRSEQGREDASPVAEGSPAIVPPGARPTQAGLKIRTPTMDARVPAKVVVKGSRATPVDRDLHAWLFVRAEVEGGRWYVYPKEITANRDGAWEAELALGGARNVRHELRVGVVDPATHQWLVRLVRDYPGEPIDELPPGFWDEATVVVTRN